MARDYKMLKLFNDIWIDSRKFTEDGEDYVRCPCGEVVWGHSLTPWNFSHIKSKGAHPELKYRKDNLTILCKHCHTNIHNGKK